MGKDRGDPAELLVGIITAPRGVSGEVRVQPLTDDPYRFRRLETVSLYPPRGNPRDMAVERARVHRDQVFLKLSGVASREQAEELRNSELRLPRSQAVELPEGHYFHFQIIGLRVHTEEGWDVGTVVDILEPGPHDVYVIGGAYGELLVPAVKEWVLEVDLERELMTIRALPGWLEG